jgi:hypothetical protein
MNVGSVSDTYILLVEIDLGSTNSTPASSTPASSPTLPQDASPQLSPLAQVLSQLQQLQQQNPTEYAQVTGQIATNLQSAAQTAQTDGNSTAASQLSQLATDFTNASQTGQLPNIEDLAQAVSGGGHDHHGHHHHSFSTDSDNSTSDSSTSGSSGSPSMSPSAGQPQTPYLVAASSAGSQNDSLSPLAIILNALSSTQTTAQTAN